jgi:hypothetical protein
VQRCPERQLAARPRRESVTYVCLRIGLLSRIKRAIGECLQLREAPGGVGPQRDHGPALALWRAAELPLEPVKIDLTVLRVWLPLSVLKANGVHASPGP